MNTAIQRCARFLLHTRVGLHVPGSYAPARDSRAQEAVGNGTGEAQSGRRTAKQLGQTMRSRIPLPDAPDTLGESMWDALTATTVDTGDSMLEQEATDAAAPATDGEMVETRRPWRRWTSGASCIYA